MKMTEKDNVSIATVQMKPDYAPSEVYSSASEPPPAYKRQANSVKIARIAAYTVIASSFIIGVFILSAAYLEARASCDQVQALDSVLEKELVLETMQQASKELPRAEALIGKESRNPKREIAADDLPVNEVDNSLASEPLPENDESKDMHRNVPVDLDLSDLAATLLNNNKKSKMNCVVERKRIVEDIDRPARTVALPFGVNMQMDPKKAQITGERISIFCDSDDDDEKSKKEDDESTEEDAESIRPMFIPIQRFPIPFGAIPQQNPLTHMPQRMLPLPPQQQQPQSQSFRPMPYNFHMRPPVPPQFMQPPQPQNQFENNGMGMPPTAHLRIQMQELPIREIHMANDIPVQITSNAGSGNREMPREMPRDLPQLPPLPHFQVQRIPLDVALRNAGVTAEDLRNIQRMVKEHITEELRNYPNEDVNSSESDSNSSEDSEDLAPSPPRMTFPATQSLPLLPVENEPPVPKETMTPPNPDPVVPIGRAAYGRSLAHPVNIPVSLVQSSEEEPIKTAIAAAADDDNKPHIVQPRSVKE